MITSLIISLIPLGMTLNTEGAHNKIPDPNNAEVNVFGIPLVNNESSHEPIKQATNPLSRPHSHEAGHAAMKQP